MSQADTDYVDWLAEINRWCETRHKTSDYTTPKALRLQLTALALTPMLTIKQDEFIFDNLAQAPVNKSAHFSSDR